MRAKAIILSLLMVTGGFVTQSATASVSWAPNPRWSQVNALAGAGIFQQDLRMFDDTGAKMTDDAGQHGTVYVRTDVHQVTLTYDCTKKQGIGTQPASACAGSTVQFGVDISGFDLYRVDLTFDGVKQKENDALYLYKNEVADSNGVASLVIGVTNRGKFSEGLTIGADDYLGVSVSNCDRTVRNGVTLCDTSDRAGTTDTVGPLNVLFEGAGYYPQVKMLNQDRTPALPNCGGLNWAKDETWDWSVYKRSWFGEYACVYAKSYQVGDWVTIPYQVLDIWGAPMVNQPVDFFHASTPPNCGSLRCKWGPEVAHKYTDKNGYVTFTVQNLNTAAEACANQGYNDDTKETHTCSIGVGFNASTGMSPESQDLFWPQFVNTTEIQQRYINVHVTRRGDLDTEANSDNVRDSNGVKNPSLPVDTNGEVSGGPDFQSTTVRALLDIKPLYNSNPDKICFIKLDAKNPKKVRRLPNCKERSVLYSPDVTVTATNGGRVLRVCPDTNGPEVCTAARLPMAWDITDASQMKTSETFGFQYLSELLFTATKPGRTVFTIRVGNQDFEVYQSYTTAASYARSLSVVAPQQSALTGRTSTVKFSVVDRFGNGYPGIPVSLTQAGGSFVPSDVASLVTDADGNVVVSVTNPTAGSQTVSAAIVSGGADQIGNAGNSDIGLAASVTNSTVTVNWSGVFNTSPSTVSGAAKVNSKLTASAGKWSSNGSVKYAYAWYACKTKAAALATVASNCTAIRGATASSFTVTKSQKKLFIAVAVTATSGTDTARSVSATSAAVS